MQNRLVKSFTVDYLDDPGKLQKGQKHAKENVTERCCRPAANCQNGNKNKMLLQARNIVHGNILLYWFCELFSNPENVFIYAFPELCF